MGKSLINFSSEMIKSYYKFLKINFLSVVRGENYYRRLIYNINYIARHVLILLWEALLIWFVKL